MLKLSQAIPEDVPDGTNPQAVKDFLTQLKLCVEEIVQKAKSIQTPVRTTAPTVNDFEVEGEDVRYNTGGVRRTYTLLDGSVRVHTET